MIGKRCISYPVGLSNGSKGDLEGIITFGMVSIPVKLYSASTSKSVSMRLVHKKCDSRIREQRYCPRCEKVVEYSELTKGYEYSRNEYVKLSDKDFVALPLPNKHAIEITDFVRLERLDKE
ncbi:MAG: hypothetical protein K2X93_27435 [Candidatus Obscuribacterales bacterium]|nr:hypothetical protein [Candidatus Obscuribacterales bacterium]